MFFFTIPRNAGIGIYLCGLLNSFSFAQYSQARSLFTRCVKPDEVGKIFSAVAIIAAIAPLISNVILRKLYNATIDVFPQAFLVLAGVLYLTATLGNAFLFTRREFMMGVDVTESNGSSRCKDSEMHLSESEKEPSSSVGRNEIE